MKGEDFLGPNAPSSPGRTQRDKATRRKQLYALMGDLPERQSTPTARKGYTR